MSITELFVASNEALAAVITHIRETDWQLAMPPGSTRKPSTLQQAVRYHTYDDAWVPDMLAGQIIAAVGDRYEYLLTSDDDVVANYLKFNALASTAVAEVTDLNAVAHLSYGEYPVRDYLQHIISFRAFRAYDIAKMTGQPFQFDAEVVRALSEEFSPVVETYRMMGVFPPAVSVPESADEQTKLMAMVGRS